MATTAHALRCRLATAVLCSIALICSFNVANDLCCSSSVSLASFKEVSALVNERLTLAISCFDVSNCAVNSCACVVEVLLSVFNRASSVANRVSCSAVSVFNSLHCSADTVIGDVDAPDEYGNANKHTSKNNPYNPLFVFHGLVPFIEVYLCASDVVMEIFLPAHNTKLGVLFLKRAIRFIRLGAPIRHVVRKLVRIDLF